MNEKNVNTLSTPKSLCRLNRNRGVRRPLLFPLVGIIGIQLLFGAFSDVEAQEANNPSLEVVLAELRRLVSEDRWSDALQFTRRTSGSMSGFEWNYFAPYIHAAATRMDDEPQQKEGRAEAAAMLGLFEKAMDNYKLWASLSKSEHDRRSAHSGLAKCAWAAACAAVREGDYGAASRHLDIMRDYGQTWIAEEGTKKGSLVRKLMEEPNSVAVRIEFADGFWIANPPALGVGHAGARQLLIDTLKLTPPPDQRLQLYELIQQHSFAMADTATALDFTERICADFAARPDDCDKALFKLAQHYTAQKHPDKAVETLHRILRLHPRGKQAGMAHLGLSEIFAAKQDEAKMLAHLEQAAKAQPHETQRHIMDTSDSRQVAIVRLGRHYQDRKEYAKALEYFRAWAPQSWCGNCAAQFAYERDLYIAQCLVALGNAELALRENLMPHLMEGGGAFYHDARIPSLAVRLCEGKRDLDGLIKTLRPHATGEYSVMARIALGLAEIRVACRDGEIDTLIDRLRHSGSYVLNVREPRDNWQAPAAAQALSEMKGREYPALLKQYKALREQETNDEIRGRLSWVLYAIALSQADGAEPFLKDLLREAEGSPSPVQAVGVDIDDMRYFVSVAAERNRKESTVLSRERCGMTKE